MNWSATEPVRLYLYPVIVTIVALLVGRGILASEEAPLWLALAAAALGVPAVEAARSKVYSPATVARLKRAA